jgi:hypothetical protein
MRRRRSKSLNLNPTPIERGVALSVTEGEVPNFILLKGEYIGSKLVIQQNTINVPLWALRVIEGASTQTPSAYDVHNLHHIVQRISYK